MNLQIALLILFVHLLLSLIYSIFILSGKSHLRKEQILLIFFVPLFGLISALVIEFLNILREEGSLPIQMEPLWLGDDILWVTLKSFHEKGDVVPLEEAIIIDDVKVRRKYMLQTLYSDPLKYLDVLNIAKYNDDVETSHYATTTISEAQKNFQLSIQKMSVAVEKNPDDKALLDKYIDTLEKYIDSGLLEMHLLKNLRIVYGGELDKKLSMMKNDKDTLIKKLRNCIELKEFDTAFDIGNTLIANWPQDENSWIESIRMCVDSQDGDRLKEVLAKMRTKKIDWGNEGKQQVGAWLETVK